MPATHAHHPMTLSKSKEEINAGCSIDEMQATLLALGEAVEQRDENTGDHCKRLACLGVAIGIRLGLDQENLVALYRGGYLHDVGKVGIPDSILLKPGKLTSDEWVTMRSHTTRGEEICCHVKALTPVLPIIRHHHERWDGTGYPDGLREKQIPLLARIMQVADIYDALTNPRPYRKACSPEEALSIIREETARGWRDPDVTRVFLALYDEVLAQPADEMRTSLVNLDLSIRHAFAPGDGVLLPIPAH